MRLVTAHRSGSAMEIAAALPAGARARPRRRAWRSPMPGSWSPGLDVRDRRIRKPMPACSPVSACSPPAAGPRARRCPGPDGLWLDLSGVAHLFGGEEAMCARILRFLRPARLLGPDRRRRNARRCSCSSPLRRRGSARSSVPPAARPRRSPPLPLAALRVEEDA